MTIKVTGKNRCQTFDEGYSYKYLYLIKPHRRYLISVILKQKLKEKSAKFYDFSDLNLNDLEMALRSMENFDKLFYVSKIQK